MRERVRVKNRVLYRSPDIKSHAALILLNKKYYLLTKPTRPLWRIWLSFRNRYLKRVEKKHGVLQCHYCGLKPLYKNTRKTPYKHRATIDHVKPRSKGGREYDERNLVVSCAYCNHKKADKSLCDFTRTKGPSAGNDSLIQQSID